MVRVVVDEVASISDHLLAKNILLSVHLLVVGEVYSGGFQL